MLITVNVVFVPQYGYMACAWAGVAGYATAMLLSYFVGQKYYPIAYPLRDILIYIVVAALLFVAADAVNSSSLPVWASAGINTVGIALFAILIIKKEGLIRHFH